MEQKKIKVGVVQATPALFDIEGTIDIIIKWIAKGKAAQCELLLFPESFIPCYPRGLSFDAVVGKRTDKSKADWLVYWQNSLSVNSIQMDRLSEAIQQAGIMVALGVTEREDIGGSLYCTLLYFGKDGKIIGKHRKLKPTGLERYVWGDGDSSTLTTLKTEAGIIGGLICWENYMPLARFAMYSKGVEIYLAPTADDRESWQSTMQHIALEGRCFVLSCNQFVAKSAYPADYLSELEAAPELISRGGSVILSPTGQVLAGPLWDKEGLLTATLDFEVLAKSKLEFDVVGHYARTDVFSYHAAGQPDTVIV